MELDIIRNHIFAIVTSSAVAIRLISGSRRVHKRAIARESEVTKDYELKVSKFMMFCGIIVLCMICFVLLNLIIKYPRFMLTVCEGVQVCAQ